MVLKSLAASGSLALFIEPPGAGRWGPMTPESISAELGGAGWVLSDFSAPPTAQVPTVQLFPDSAGTESALAQLSGNRRLLRVTAPENAQPGLNWALGFDAVRVLEARTASGGIDWLLSIDDDDEDEEDLRERILCGVNGESLRRETAFHEDAALRLLSVSTEVALALPESCRAARWAGALPQSAEVVWRVGEGRSERGFADDGEPFWVEAASAADAVSAAAALPPGSRWAAHVKSFTPVSRECVQRLRDAGCGGLAVRWSACAAAVRAGAPQSQSEGEWAAALREWAVESGIR